MLDESKFVKLLSIILVVLLSLLIINSVNEPKVSKEDRYLEIYVESDPNLQLVDTQVIRDLRTNRCYKVIDASDFTLTVHQVQCFKEE